MLKDLTRNDWIKLLQFPADRIPQSLILRGTRNLRAQYEAALPFFTNVVEIGSPNGLIEDVLVGEHAGVDVGFACVYGAPMASEITHLFGVLGTKTVILTGNCGALDDDLQAGDLFCATEAFRGEGASQYYAPKGDRVFGSAELVEAAASHTDSLHTGAIYTTSALFTESAEDLDRWHAQGFAALDMETAAVFAVAEHFGMRRVSLLYAFDNPRRREHLLLTDEGKDARRRAGDDSIQRLALELAVEGRVV